MLQSMILVSLLMVLAGVVWLVIIARRNLSAPKAVSGLASDLDTPMDEPQIMQSAISRLTFQESLGATAFIDATTEATIQNVGSLLNKQLGDAGIVVVQGISLLNGSVQMAMEFTASGQKLMKLGVAMQATDASGKLLPFLQDVATGKTIELGRCGKQVGHLATKLANVGTMVVGVAHMISGADVVKRLKKIEKHLQYLVACRRFDQMAKLEAIYGHARELLSRPLDILSQHELRSLRRDVLEIRSAWRQELRWKMDNIEDPAQASSLPTWFRRIPLFRRGNDTKLVEDISQAEMEIAAIEYSLRLDLALAAASGSLDSFLGLTLPSELTALKGIETLIRSKSQLISGRYPDLSADGVVDRLSELHTAYSQMASDSQPQLVA